MAVGPLADWPSRGTRSTTSTKLSTRASASWSAWYELRALVLRKQSNREEKIGRLRAWFSI
jgi:hypothetical protein